MDYKIIYIKTTENCNLYCEHCFVPRVEKKMNIETIEEILKFLNLNFLNETEIRIIWHGGEPTLIGVEWLEKSINRLNKNVNNNIKLIHEIQTNLINYNNEWKNLYQKYFNNYIGISYDFNIRYFQNSNQKFEDIFWKNFKQLEKDNINYNMIITITKNIIDMGAVKFWNWILDNKIPSLHLERLTKTGYAIDNWNKIGFNNKEYNDFMLEFSKLYINYIIQKEKLGKEHLNYIKISPLNSLLINTIQNKRATCAGACSNFFTFNPDGTIKGCTSLENKIGKIGEDYKKIIADNIISKRFCLDCEFQKVCNSGCPTSPIFDESNDCLGNYRLLKFFQTIGKFHKFNINLNNNEIFNNW